MPSFTSAHASSKCQAMFLLAVLLPALPVPAGGQQPLQGSGDPTQEAQPVSGTGGYASQATTISPTNNTQQITAYEKMNLTSPTALKPLTDGTDGDDTLRTVLIAVFGSGICLVLITVAVIYVLRLRRQTGEGRISDAVIESTVASNDAAVEMEEVETKPDDVKTDPPTEPATQQDSQPANDQDTADKAAGEEGPSEEKTQEAANTDGEEAPKATTDGEEAPKATPDGEEAQRATTGREEAPRATTQGNAGDKGEQQATESHDPGGEPSASGPPPEKADTLNEAPGDVQTSDPVADKEESPVMATEASDAAPAESAGEKAVTQGKEDSSAESPAAKEEITELSTFF